MADDDGTRAAKKRCREAGPAARRSCVRNYLQQKRALDAAGPSGGGSSHCPLPGDKMTNAERQSMARCLRTPPPPENDAAKSLDRLLHQHLFLQPQSSPPSRCKPFAMTVPDEPSSRLCLRRAGAARWTAAGLASNSSDGDHSLCSRQRLGTTDLRCLVGNRDLMFLGNSVVRRQMYTLLDVLAGPAAHRLLPNGTSVRLPLASEAETLATTRVWDKDGHADGYHAAQLVTMDLATGEHRFHLPSELCAVGSSHANFNAGRAKQWTSPSHSLPAGALATSKWATREWRPLVSMAVTWPASTDGCAGRHLVWAGSHQGSLAPHAAPPAYSLPPRDDATSHFAVRLRAALLDAARAHLAASDPASVEWSAIIYAAGRTRTLCALTHHLLS